MSKQPPVQQAPPVQRLRIRYAKRGRLRFTSHRDFSRAFERALARARIPMAYSSGFNPHPRISYAGASPTGAASEAEYLEIALADVVDPAQVHTELDAALPPGLDVLEVVVSEPGGPALHDLLQASRWRIEVPWEPHATAAVVTTFLERESVLVERMTKKGLREFDVRAAIVRLETAGPGALSLVLRHGVPSVRPDDVVSALASLAELPATGALFTRDAQGPLAEGDTEPGDPLTARKHPAGE